MKGTFQYCHTAEAVKRMNDGDILQNLTSEQYFKKENGITLTSADTFKWCEYALPIEHFEADEEWRSLSNLHYYQDLKKHFKDESLNYLTIDNKVLSEDEPGADQTKKRWFQGNLLT